MDRITNVGNGFTAGSGQVGAENIGIDAYRRIRRVDHKPYRSIHICDKKSPLAMFAHVASWLVDVDLNIGGFGSWHRVGQVNFHDGYCSTQSIGDLLRPPPPLLLECEFFADDCLINCCSGRRVRGAVFVNLWHAIEQFRIVLAVPRLVQTKLIV